LVIACTSATRATWRVGIGLRGQGIGHHPGHDQAAEGQQESGKPSGFAQNENQKQNNACCEEDQQGSAHFSSALLSGYKCHQPRRFQVIRRSALAYTEQKRNIVNRDRTNEFIKVLPAFPLAGCSVHHQCPEDEQD
jgi:hypothetical protein